MDDELIEFDRPQTPSSLEDIEKYFNESSGSSSGELDSMYMESVDVNMLDLMNNQQQQQVMMNPFLFATQAPQLLPQIPLLQPFQPVVVAPQPVQQQQEKKQAKKGTRGKKRNTPSPSSSSSDSDSSRPAKRYKRKREQEEIRSDEQELERLSNIPNHLLTEEDKELKKKLRNRQTAKKSRDRQKNELEDQRKINAELMRVNNGLVQENSVLKVQLQRLNQENLELKNMTHQLESDLRALRESSPTQATLDIISTDDFDQITYDFSEPHELTLAGGRTKTYIVLVLALFACCSVLAFLNSGLLSTRTGRTIPTSPIDNTLDRDTLLRFSPDSRHLLNASSDYCPETDATAISPALSTESEDRKQMELVADDDEEFYHQRPFNPEDMKRQGILFPSGVKKHFGDYVKPARKENPAVGSEIDRTLVPRSTEDVTAYSRKAAQSTDTENNAKQLQLIPMLLSSPNPNKILKNMGDKNDLHGGYLHSMDEEEVDPRTIRLYCPNIYPVVGDKRTNITEQLKNIRGGKASVVFMIPIETDVFETTDGQTERVTRVVQFETTDIKLSESYLSYETKPQPIGV